ncbi:MAG: response regulator [Legionella sp.]|uniref:response regulator n=1 Tax=Legionella sp. TaxID=459 RepID=UPI00284C54EC|nr:response regulator [Legionella sp.]
MSPHGKNVYKQDDIEAINHYYMEIINAMPNIVYWVDMECNLKGCNSKFRDVLGLKKLKDFNGTPYQKMIEFAHWDEARIEALKLEDMKVLFSGESQHHIEEEPIQNQNGKVFYFHSSRVPIFDLQKEVIGLVVVLTDVSMSKELAASTPIIEDEEQEIQNAIKEGHLPTVLMVEDNVIAQNVEKALLTSLNCHVDIAETADNALKLFQPGKYDLVLMDIGLEDSSGYIVAKQLRQKEKDTKFHVPIIALTGYEADVVKYDCQHYFMEGAISKPLTSEQAEQIIKHYVYHLDVPVRGLKSI